MSRKRYFLLVRCLCAMLCCITFLLTSLTIEASSVSARMRSAYNGTFVKSLNATQTYYTFFNYDVYSNPSSISGTINEPSYKIVNATSRGTITHGTTSDSLTIINGDSTVASHNDTVTLSVINSNNTIYHGADYDFYTYVIPALPDDDVDYNKYYELVCFPSTPTVSNGSIQVSETYFELCNDGKKHRMNSAYRTLVKASDILVSDSSGTLGLACEIHLHVKVNNPTSGSASISFPLEAALYEISSDVYDSQAGQSVNDSGANNKIEQGNEIAQDSNDVQHDTNNKVTGFFNAFWDNLLHIFVPEDGFFSTWFNDLNDFMSQKLGFLWAPFDFVLTFLYTIYNGSNTYDLVFPEVSWLDGTVLIPETHLNFENIGGQSFPELREAIYIGFDIAMLGWVLTLVYKKLSMVFGGDSGDN